MTRPAASGEEPHRVVEPLVEPVGDGLDRRALQPEHLPAELDRRARVSHRALPAR